MLAKSRLDSIETLISQALIDMDLSHEEFVTILKKKDKYENYETEYYKIKDLKKQNRKIKEIKNK